MPRAINLARFFRTLQNHGLGGGLTKASALLALYQSIKPLTSREIAAITTIPTQTLQSTLESLKAQDLIRSEDLPVRNPTDPHYLYHLTPTARKLITAARRDASV